MKRLALITLFFIGLEATLYSQSIQGLSGGKASSLSDQQIMQLWQRAQKSGVSEADAVKQLLQSGLSATDVTAFKRRLVDLQNGLGKSKFKTDNLIKDTSNFLRDSTWVFEVPQLKKMSPYYGFDFFNTPDISYEPNFLISTPPNYVLGAGDELTLSLEGLNETSFSDVVTREGNFQIPHVGMVKIGSLTIEEAKQKIKQKLGVPYPAIKSGKTSIQLILGNVKTIRITIIGEAEKPGAYVVSSLASFFNVLYLSGGPLLTGSLRKIELIRNNKIVEKIDFYTFLQKGILEKNLRLEDQDIIRFPVYTKRVSLGGEVKRPAIYELLEKETLSELLNYAGGLGDTAYKETAKIIQIEGSEKKVRDISFEDFNNYIPHNADSVYFEKISSRFSNRIFLLGAAKRPGIYELTDKLTFQQLIKKAGGLREDAFLNRAIIKRTNVINAERTVVSINLNELLTNKKEDIDLQKEDSILISANDEVTDMPTITIAGNVRNPGTYPYRKGMFLEDAILTAKGFNFQAATHKVEISRIRKDNADTLSNKLLDLITRNVDSSLQTSKISSTPLEPLDYIFIPKLLIYNGLGSIKLRGEVLYTGDYALERRNETVKEVIIRAGGLTPNASMADVQVFRNKTRVSTDLLTTNNSVPFLLKNGDSIFIPRNEPFVEVRGGVFNPQILNFTSNSFKSYISQTGGITDKGNLKKGYIQYSNGVNRNIKHFLFFRSYPKVKSGSTIYIPEISETQKKGISLIELSVLTGVLTATISLISVLKL